MTLMKLRLDFPFTDLSQHFRMYLVQGGLCIQVFHSGSWSLEKIRGGVK